MRSTLYTALLLTIYLLFGFARDSSKPTRDDNLALGNPSRAKKHPANFLIRHNQYVLSYNSKKGIPNWVSWHLSNARKGPYKRTNPFRSDDLVPAEWYRVTKKDYTNSGFDRGHMCPSDDRDRNKGDNDNTFFMTNMVPQAHRCNDGPWGDLEAYCRKLVEQGKELYIVAGPLGRGGEGKFGYANSIANGKVEVPAFVWKVIVVLNVGSNDINRITSSTRAIAVMIPNRENANECKWYDYMISVDDVERSTGFDFFSEVVNNVEDCFEERVDLVLKK